MQNINKANGGGDNMRYFLVSYQGAINGNDVIGHNAFKFGGFFSLKAFQKDMEGGIDGAAIITNIFEFKNKQDYEDFKK